MINYIKLTSRFTAQGATFSTWLCAFACMLGSLSAQTSETEKSEDTRGLADIGRPQYDDPTSRKLIKNYLTATGGKQAHLNLHAVVATGTINEAGKTKSFRLIERHDGRRHLTYKWRLLGRDYEDVISFDGVVVWKQRLSPKKGIPQKVNSIEAWHFANQHWLLRPFVVPLKAKYVFSYQGSSKVAGRDSHLIAGLGANNQKSFYYFDKETFLVTRWGGYGFIGGIKEYLDYQATRFEYVGGVLLPKEISLLAENQAFGKIEIESVEANPELDLKMFYQPPDNLPKLRQRTVQP